jgi:hypothetical protein
MCVGHVGHSWRVSDQVALLLLADRSNFRYSIGFCFRAPLYRNKWFLFYFVFLFAFNSVMLLLPSTGRDVSILKSATVSSVNVLDDVFKMMPLPDGFKLVLYAVLCAGCFGMVVTEWMLFKMFQKHSGLELWQMMVHKFWSYAVLPLMRVFSFGKIFKFRAVSDQAAEVNDDVL